MSIECYYSTCPYHSIHDGQGDDGPFCYEANCKATNEQILEFRKDNQKRTQLPQFPGYLPRNLY